MKKITLGFIFMLFTSPEAHAKDLKPQEFIDVVYKIQTVDSKSLVSFQRTPSIYEITQDLKDGKSLLSKLEESQKSQKALRVKVDPLTRKILEVKGP